MALYIPKLNLVFLHIYKTAGTAIRSAFMRLDRDCVEIGYGHASYYEIADKVEDKKIFSVVRNPYDWIYSLYQYGRNHSSHPFYCFCITHTFDEFVGWYLKNEHILDTLNESGELNGRLQTQSDYLSFNGELKVPDVMKMESLEYDLNIFLLQLGFKAIRLETLNSTPYEKPNHQDFNKETIEHINKRYESDFVNFNYNML